MSSADASNMKVLVAAGAHEVAQSRSSPIPVLKVDGSLAKSLPERLEAWADYQKNGGTSI